MLVVGFVLRRNHFDGLKSRVVGKEWLEVKK
jgi:hypothetical protein